MEWFDRERCLVSWTKDRAVPLTYKSVEKSFKESLEIQTMKQAMFQNWLTRQISWVPISCQQMTMVKDHYKLRLNIKTVNTCLKRNKLDLLQQQSLMDSIFNHLQMTSNTWQYFQSKEVVWTSKKSGHWRKKGRKGWNLKKWAYMKAVLEMNKKVKKHDRDGAVVALVKWCRNEMGNRKNKFLKLFYNWGLAMKST